MMKRKLAIVGLSIGLVFGVGMLVYTYTQAPGMPGPFEVVFLLVILGFLAAVPGALGFAVGCIIDFLHKKDES